MKINTSLNRGKCKQNTDRNTMVNAIGKGWCWVGFILKKCIKRSDVLRKGTTIHGGFAYLVIML